MDILNGMMKVLPENGSFEESQKGRDALGAGRNHGKEEEEGGPYADSVMSP
jgi:hypothetical protein